MQKENYITSNNKVRKGDVINVTLTEFDVVATTPEEVTIRRVGGSEYKVSYEWLEQSKAFFVKDTASIEYFEMERAWEDAQEERYF